MKYLNPRADLTFKRVFGEHPDLVMSLLNALLPLAANQEITDIEYLPSDKYPVSQCLYLPSSCCYTFLQPKDEVYISSDILNYIIRYI